MRNAPSLARTCLWALLTLVLGAGARATEVSSYAQVRERPIPGDPVKIDSGLVAGKLLPSGVRAYFGVPFAAPPVRELRWREPQPVPAWNGVFDADRPAPECIQALRAHDINNYFGEEATSEDCLYLNIWAPAAAGSGTRKPVVVWIYGGGFTAGSASMANYGGETLARKGVVYVAIAYRVGAFGFLALPALTAESPHHASGAVGFLDQIAALQWVRRNIAAFGGDPGNVTLMGQSAGSMSISVLQSSPLTRGLFQHLVGLSGSVVVKQSLGGPWPLAAAEHEGTQLQEALHATDLAALRQLPADRILAAAIATRTRFGPTVDGYVLPASPLEIFAVGKQNDVPMLIGYAHDENVNFGLEMRAWARAQVATGKSPVYAYLFARVHPYAPGVVFSDHNPKTAGAYHSGDIPYWLGTLDAFNLFRTTRDWTGADRALSDFMSDAIVSFATTGNPNRTGARDWPAYRPNDESIRELNLQSRVVPWPIN